MKTLGSAVGRNLDRAEAGFWGSSVNAGARCADNWGMRENEELLEAWRASLEEEFSLACGGFDRELSLKAAQREALRKQCGEALLVARAADRREGESNEAYGRRVEGRERDVLERRGLLERDRLLSRLELGLFRLRGYERCVAEYAVAQRFPGLAEKVAATGFVFGSVGHGTDRRGVPALPEPIESPSWADELRSRASYEWRLSADLREMRFLRSAISRCGVEPAESAERAYMDVALLWTACQDRRAREGLSWSRGGAEAARRAALARFEALRGDGDIERSLAVARSGEHVVFAPAPAWLEREERAAATRRLHGKAVARFRRELAVRGASSGVEGARDLAARATELALDLRDVRAGEASAREFRLAHRALPAGGALARVDGASAVGRGQVLFERGIS